MTLKFDLEKFNLVLDQYKIFISLTYFDKLLMTVVQLAVWMVDVHMIYMYVYTYIWTEKLYSEEENVANMLKLVDQILPFFMLIKSCW